MIDPLPLPATLPRVVLVVASFAAGGAALLSATFSTLRQGHLLDAAIATCASRAEEADRFLARAPEVQSLLATERIAADERAPALLSTETAADALSAATELATRFSFSVEGSRLGTRRGGDTLDTVPATAAFAGDRARLPELLDAFYAQPLAVRLVSLDLDLPQFGSSEVHATLRWEVAAGQSAGAPVDDPVTRWSPPVLLGQGDRGTTRIGNHAGWVTAERAAAELRARAPALRRLAAQDAERNHLEQQRIAVQRWQEASGSEALAIQRRLPELFRRLDLSAEGRAALRPGPAGLMVAESP